MVAISKMSYICLTLKFETPIDFVSPNSTHFSIAFHESKKNQNPAIVNCHLNHPTLLQYKLDKCMSLQFNGIEFIHN